MGGARDHYRNDSGADNYYGTNPSVIGIVGSSLTALILAFSGDRSTADANCRPSR